MIAEEDHHRVPGQPRLVERVQDPAHVVVDEADARVVGGDRRAGLLRRRLVLHEDVGVVAVGPLDVMTRHVDEALGRGRGRGDGGRVVHVDVLLRRHERRVRPRLGHREEERLLALGELLEQGRRGRRHLVVALLLGGQARVAIAVGILPLPLTFFLRREVLRRGTPLGRRGEAEDRPRTLPSLRASRRTRSGRTTPFASPRSRSGGTACRYRRW